MNTGESKAGDEIRMGTAALIARALQWAHDDCDADMAQRALQMVKHGDTRQLNEHFGGELEFGTAGLRAKVGPGPLCINTATVRRASAAVARFLLSRSPSPSVVLAFDARSSSRSLAEQCAGVLAAAGVRVLFFSEPTPTPLAAFAVLHLACHAAIVVTASHNPRDYNGVKLYAADGIQIIPPADAEIARYMRQSLAARAIACIGDAFAGTSNAVQPIGSETREAYIGAVGELLADACPPASASSLKIAYTPLHGVGAQTLLRVLNTAGFADVVCVSEQLEPDGTFPTAPFPNPEEAGVMDAVFSLAETDGCHLALANDPDADRLAVGIPNAKGQFYRLTGNQVGILLAEHLLQRYSGSLTPLVVRSVVSSPLLDAVALHHGARVEQTLTGFKWIERPALALNAETEFVCGFEEALGYALSNSVRDKDGISAALAFARMAACAHADGKDVRDLLAAIYDRHGLWVSDQLSVVCAGSDGVRQIDHAMRQVRCHPPTDLDGLAVTAVVDFQQNAPARAPWLGCADLIEFQLGGYGRVLMRPSGTEPKLKIYVDLRGGAPGGKLLESGQQELMQAARRVAEALRRSALPGAP